MGGAILVNCGDRGDTALMRLLHGLEALHGVLVYLINVDQLVMDMAKQHEVVNVVG
jgi:hypothetical protein